jgi:hypothetical protein
VNAAPDQTRVAGLGGLERFDADHPTEMIDNCGHMKIYVSVDTAGHRPRRFYDGHGHPFPLASGQGVARTCREGDQEPPDLFPQAGPAPTRPVSAIPEPTDGSFEGQPGGVSRFESQTDPGTQPTIGTPPLDTVDPQPEARLQHHSAGFVSTPLPMFRAQAPAPARRDRGAIRVPHLTGHLE